MWMRAALAVAWALWAAAAAWAQGQGAVESEVVVTASRRAVLEHSTPRAVSVVSRDGMGDAGSRTVPEALRRAPGVHVQETAHGHGTPIVRGLLGPQVLLAIDGVRLNDAGFRTGPSQYLATVPPDVVERIEVLRGPSGVLYGSDAMGGVVNVIPRAPSGRAGSHGAAAWRHASAEASETGRLEVDLGLGDLALLAGGSHRDFGDLQAGRHAGTLPATGYREASVDATVRLRPRAGREWRLTALHLEQDDVPRTHSTTRAVPYRGTRVGTRARRAFDPQRLSFAALTVEDRSAGARVAESRLTVSLKHRLEGLEDLRTDGRFERFEDEVTSPGLLAHATLDLPGGHRLTPGLDWYHDRLGSRRRAYSAAGVPTAFPRGNLPDDTDYDVGGLYLQDDWTVVSDRLEVGAGARWALFAVRARETRESFGGVDFGTIDETFQDVGASLAARARLAGALWAVSGLHRGFRGPSADELAALRETSSSFDVPNPGLGPESALAAEGGLQWAGRRCTGSLFLHHTLVEDTIDREDAVLDGQTVVNGKKVQRRANVGRARITGVEAAGRVAPAEGWEATLGADWTWGVEEGEPLRRNPPARGTAAVRRRVAEAWWLEAGCRAAREQHRLNPNDRNDDERIPPGGTPGYAVYDLRLAGALGEAARLALAVENLADRDYREHGSGLNGAGANAVIELRLAW
ncbi:MAG: TonB-dependent receptor [Planctomycetes bacterium]|nr:TonB-dependent receptor [Planctomycetota bacterium]